MSEVIIDCKFWHLRTIKTQTQRTQVMVCYQESSLPEENVTEWVFHWNIEINSCCGAWIWSCGFLRFDGISLFLDWHFFQTLNKNKTIPIEPPSRKMRPWLNNSGDSYGDLSTWGVFWGHFRVKKQFLSCSTHKRINGRNKIRKFRFSCPQEWENYGSIFSWKKSGRKKWGEKNFNTKLQ